MSTNTLRSRRVVVPAIVAALAIMIAGVAASGGSGSSDTLVRAGPVGSSASSNVTASTTDAADATGDDVSETGAPAINDAAMSLGDRDAPVVMINYSEFQCPFCGRFARDTADQLKERYVDTGILRIEWRDFPYLGEESFRAAVAGRAAAAQGEFWAFHDELFADQAATPNSGKLTDAYLIDTARGLGLDVDRFETDLRDETGAEDIRADFEAGINAGVNGTPAFFVNETPVFGAQPIEVFSDVIETAAAAAS